MLTAAVGGYLLATLVQLAAAWRHRHAERRLQVLLAQVRAWMVEDEHQEEETDADFSPDC